MQVGPFWCITSGTLTGPWHVAALQNAWYIVSLVPTKGGAVQCCKIGKVRMRGTNYCDRARDEARQRNAEIFKDVKMLPTLLGVHPSLDVAIAKALEV